MRAAGVRRVTAVREAEGVKRWHFQMCACVCETLWLGCHGTRGSRRWDPLLQGGGCERREPQALAGAGWHARAQLCREESWLAS